MKPLIPEAQVLYRVFQIQSGQKTGTAFRLPIAGYGRDILVTAAHCLDDKNEVVSLRDRNNVLVKESRSAFTINDEQDMAFAWVPRSSHLRELPFGRQGCGHGQEVLIMGFPAMGFVFSQTMPFVVGARASFLANLDEVESGKKGIIHNEFLVDRGIPGGMSGAPVVYRDFKTGELAVLGVARDALFYDNRNRVSGSDYDHHRFEPQFTRCSYISRDTLGLSEEVTDRPLPSRGP